MIRRLVPVLACAVLAAGCADLSSPAVPPVAPGAARLQDDAVVSFDGARLPLQVWAPADREPWAVIVAVHGMNDYSNAFRLAGPRWAAAGVATYAYDQRGFGRAPLRGRWAGEATMTEDLRTVVALVRARHPGATVAVAGESMGGAVAIAAFASDRPPDADRLILSAPAVWGWSHQPILYRAGLWVGARLIGDRVLDPPRFVTEKVQASDNVEELRRMGRDPLMIWGASPRTLYGLVSLMETAWRSVGSVRAPVLWLYGANDDLIPPEATFDAARALKPEDRSAYYAGGWHLLLRDLQADVVYRDVEAFLRDARAPLPSGAPPLPTGPERRAGRAG